MSSMFYLTGNMLPGLAAYSGGMKILSPKILGRDVLQCKFNLNGPTVAHSYEESSKKIARDKEDLFL